MNVKHFIRLMVSVVFWLRAAKLSHFMQWIFLVASFCFYHKKFIHWFFFGSFLFKFQKSAMILRAHFEVGTHTPTAKPLNSLKYSRRLRWRIYRVQWKRTWTWIVSVFVLAVSNSMPECASFTWQFNKLARDLPVNLCSYSSHIEIDNVWSALLRSALNIFCSWQGR